MACVGRMKELGNLIREILTEDGQSATGLEWARLCGQWAFAAAQVLRETERLDDRSHYRLLVLQAGRLAEAEEALRAKWKRAGHGRSAVWTPWLGLSMVSKVAKTQSGAKTALTCICWTFKC